MTNGSESSNTPDFAFEPPAMSESGSNNPFEQPAKTHTYPMVSTGSFPPNGGFAQPFAPFFSGPGSSFSSTSTGTSFSSIDALPAISRDFHRPASSETRRPATAGGALQSFGMFDERKNQNRDNGKPETIDETSESIFSNPFESMSKDENNQESHFNQTRRSSDPKQHLDHIVPTGWNGSTSPDQNQNPSPHTPFSLPSAPPHLGHLGFMGMSNQAQMQLNRSSPLGYTTRPQTSDGLPSYSGVNPNGVSLPSAKTLVGQLDPSQPFQSPHYATGNFAPVRDNRAASLGDIASQSNSAFPGSRHYSMSAADKFNDQNAQTAQNPNSQDPKSNELTFVPLGGPAPKKRPRRRYDEIERLYTCGWNGCEKAYGTLNHLNAHVAMQKHGEKRLPSEFKDMRKAWRKKKREQTAAMANAQYMASSSTWNPRASMSSGSEYDRRESNASFISTSDYSSHRGSVVYPGYAWDQPGSSRPNTSSSTSSADGRFPMSSAYASGMINASPAIRRQSASGHMVMPSSAAGMYKMDNIPTPVASNPYARPPPQGQNPYSFQTLTSPMPMMPSPQSQFAFQR